MIYCFDIDGTICTNTNGVYAAARVYPDMIRRVNGLYDAGHRIIFMTARGCVSKVDYTEYTRQQLDDWGFRYHELILGKKPYAHVYVDDRAERAIDWRTEGKVTAVYLSRFSDGITGELIDDLEEAKTICEHLVCVIEQKSANPELTKMIEAVRYVDEVMYWQVEDPRSRPPYFTPLPFNKTRLGTSLPSFLWITHDATPPPAGVESYKLKRLRP
jgi:hypothetical protein